MAVSIAHPDSKIQNDVWGRHPIEILEVTFDSSYPTGGEAFDPGDQRYGYGNPVAVIPLVTAESVPGYVVQYDYTAKTLQVWEQTDPAAAGGANIPLVEVANATDLSSLVVRCVCIF